MIILEILKWCEGSSDRGFGVLLALGLVCTAVVSLIKLFFDFIVRLIHGHNPYHVTVDQQEEEDDDDE